MTPDCQRGSNFYHKTLLQETNCTSIKRMAVKHLCSDCKKKMYEIDVSFK